MRHYSSLAGVWLKDAWLTIGAFDGVHRGHQEIIRQIVGSAHALGLPAVVLTFFPHPAFVLRGQVGRFYLTSPDEKATLLGELGVDAVVTYPFDRQVAGRSALDFVSELHHHLHFSHLLIGYDFALGRSREGAPAELSQFGDQLGYTLNMIEPVTLEGETVSSSQVRAALTEGEVEKAGRLLGRPYQVEGVVVHGDSRGHAIGIPTANLDVWPEKLLPRPGVYVGQATVGDEKRAAVVNLGYRPTFENTPPIPRLETHILDYDRPLYGELMKLSFMKRLRDEQRFSSVPALLEQIHLDIQHARVYLNTDRPV